MTRTELIISPDDEGVVSALGDAENWPDYAVGLTNVLREVIGASPVDNFVVDGLIVDQPLPERYADLRDGFMLGPNAAIELVIEMAAGRGPYLSLSGANRLRIESGWDGAVHIFGPRTIVVGMINSRHESVRLERREAEPDSIDILRPVTLIADGIFWSQLESDARDLVLLSERWAHGAYGCRWFRVDVDSVDDLEVSVQPGSLLCVAVKPDLYHVEADVGVMADLIDGGFTAFRAPVGSGELDYRTYPNGVDSLADIEEGFSLILRSSLLSEWCAVVPGVDGVITRQWEHPVA